MADENGADETGAESTKFTTQCQCIKWHAPKPTHDYELGGVPVCPVSYVATQQLVQRHHEAGKILRRNEIGFTPFVKDLAKRVFEEMTSSSSVG